MPGSPPARASWPGCPFVRPLRGGASPPRPVRRGPRSRRPPPAVVRTRHVTSYHPAPRNRGRITGRVTRCGSKIFCRGDIPAMAARSANAAGRGSHPSGFRRAASGLSIRSRATFQTFACRFSNILPDLFGHAAGPFRTIRSFGEPSPAFWGAKNPKTYEIRPWVRPLGRVRPVPSFAPLWGGQVNGPTARRCRRTVGAPRMPLCGPWRSGTRRTP